VKGALLAPLIDSCLPAGTTYRTYLPLNETPRLRNFVELQLSELVRPTDERSGSDIIYSIIHAVRSDSVLVRADGQLWRTFVALAPTKQLVYDRKTAEIGLLELLAEAPEPLSLVRSVTFDEHRKICVEFYAHLESRGEAVPLLKELLQAFEPQSYPMWLRILRTSSPPLDKEWGKCRQQALLQIFRERLTAIAVPLERIGQLELQICRDHEQAILRKTGTQTPAAESVASISSNPTPKDAKEKRARELLHVAVDRMSYEQMQSLLIPFGTLLDLVGTPGSK
jgi:hypothetical protein